MSTREQVQQHFDIIFAQVHDLDTQRRKLELELDDGISRSEDLRNRIVTGNRQSPSVGLTAFCQKKQLRKKLNAQ